MTTEITKRKKPAVEPASIWSPTLQKSIDAQDGTYGKVVRTVQTSQGEMLKYRTPPEHPSPLMRRLGFTRNPLTCHHDHKRLYLGTTQWRCADCGEFL